MHSVKASWPIFLTEGITTSVNDFHWLKERYNITVADEGISTCASDMHLSNADAIDLTEEGIDICFKDEHPTKVLCR